MWGSRVIALAWRTHHVVGMAGHTTIHGVNTNNTTNNTSSNNSNNATNEFVAMGTSSS